MLSEKHGGAMAYTVMFFKAGMPHGHAPMQKDLAAAKNFAQASVLVNGADAFAIYQDGQPEPVMRWRRDAART
jgi:hypothetical protein